VTAAPLDIGAIMVAMAARLAATVIPEPNHAYGWPTKAIDVGDACVGYPTAIEATSFGRGSWRVVVPFWIVAGVNDYEDTRDAVTRLIGGEDDILGALEPDLDGAVSSIQVTLPNPPIVRVFSEGGIEHLAVRYEGEVFV
jgi:hypothetical protein